MRSEEMDFFNTHSQTYTLTHSSVSHKYTHAHNSQIYAKFSAHRAIFALIEQFAFVLHLLTPFFAFICCYNLYSYENIPASFASIPFSFILCLYF